MTRWAVRLVALALAGLCGCGPALEPGVVVLRIANWGGAGDDNEFARTLREIYAEFERQNPGVRLQVEGIPGSQEYVSKVLLSHVARSAPDIITLDASSAAAFIDNGVLRDLKPYASAEVDFSWDDYYPNVVQITARGEANYAVPMDFTPMVVTYNKDLFDAAGEPYPEPDWTFEDFLAKAKRLTKGDVYGFKFINWMPGWIMWLWNRGGDVIAPIDPRPANGPAYRARGVLDTDENAATIAWLRDLVLVHKVAPALSQIAATGVDPFQDGKAAMEITGHWAMVGYGSARKIDVNRIGVAPLPSDMPPSKTVMYESGLAIGRYCKHPELAWRFIRYMTSREVQRRYHTTNIAISARKDVSQERAVNERERTFLEIVPTARGPWGAKVVGYDLVEDIGQKMMDAVLVQGVDPKTALRRAAEEIDRELARR